MRPRRCVARCDRLLIAVLSLSSVFIHGQPDAPDAPWVTLYAASGVKSIPSARFQATAAAATAWHPGDRVNTSALKATHKKSCALGACNAEYAGCAKRLEGIWNGVLRTKKVTTQRSQRRCAVVSSSDTLLHSNCGPAIDDHDMVLRFNFASNAPAYYDDVGRKTSLMFSHGANFNPPGHELGEMGREFDRKVQAYKSHGTTGQQLPSVVIQSMCAKCRFDPSLRCAKACSVAFCIGLAGCRASGFDCTSIPLDILRGATQSFAKLGGSRNSKPSSGWVGMHWANWTCDTVDAYGFPLMSSGKHYYEAEDKESGLVQEFDLSKHNIAKENSALRRHFKNDVTFWGKHQVDPDVASSTKCVQLDSTRTATSDSPSNAEYHVITDAEVGAMRLKSSTDVQIACSFEPRFMIFSRGSVEVRNMGAAIQCDQPGLPGGPIAGKPPRCRNGCVRPATLPDGTPAVMPCFSQASLREAWRSSCPSSHPPSP